jgi:hypothetical protein
MQGTTTQKITDTPPWKPQILQKCDNFYDKSMIGQHEIQSLCVLVH